MPEVQSSKSTPSVSERDVRKVASVSLVGSSVEWFDFFLFGTAASIVFPTVFFGGEKGGINAVLLSFATLGVGFLARPLGGIFWGHYGDRKGRKRAFQAALMLMAISTFLIGVLPGASAIGLAAPILLTILRFAQGIAVGGQWGGAALLATETAPPNRRGFYGSFAQLGVPIGALLGVTAYFFLFVAMGAETFMSWGWRIPFIASVIFVGFVIWTNAKLEETPEFKRLQAQAASNAEKKAGAVIEKSPVMEVLTKHWATVLLSGGAYTVTTAVYYLYIVFMLDYSTRVLGMAVAEALLPISIANLTMVAVIPITAAWSDKMGRAPLYIAGGIGTALWAFPFFAMANSGSMLMLTIAMIVGMAFLATMYGLMAAFFAELFPPKVRYSGASLGYQLGSVVGGAAVPLIAVALVDRSGSTTPVAIVIVVLAAISVLCTIALKSRPVHRD